MFKGKCRRFFFKFKKHFNCEVVNLAITGSSTCLVFFIYINVKNANVFFFLLRFCDNSRGKKAGGIKENVS